MKKLKEHIHHVQDFDGDYIFFILETQSPIDGVEQLRCYFFWLKTSNIYDLTPSTLQENLYASLVEENIQITTNIIQSILNEM